MRAIIMGQSASCMRRYGAAARRGCADEVRARSLRQIALRLASVHAMICLSNMRLGFRSSVTRMPGPREAVLAIVATTGIHGGTKAREINVEEPASSGWSSPWDIPIQALTPS